MTEAIPSPPGLPVLGNLLDIDSSDATGSLQRLLSQYGPLIKLNILGTDRYFCGSYELFDELCDDRRFQKSVHQTLQQVRNGVGSGLFTAFNDENDWAVAHRTLIPAFGPLPIQNMFDEMHDIASQMVLKWSRNGPNQKIIVTEDFTKLTLDSIALCAMDTRFNSFYHEQTHPFVQSMVDFLFESGQRTRRPAVAQMFMRESNRRYAADIETMKKTAAEVVARRRKFPSNKKDLLNAMLLGKDPKTGEAMSDESIMNNMITFLIAGHETTAGMLSFTTYYMLKNPQTWRKAQEEVDRIIGDQSIDFKHIAKLEYVQACLRESLRLSPTAPAFGRESSGNKDEIIGNGKYLIPAGSPVVCILPTIHRDPAVFGEDAAAFSPERMLSDQFKNLPASSWKPFGSGPRACIGRPFAWQEAVMALAMIVQNFDLQLADPSYELRIKQTLTIKPDGLEIYATPRKPLEPGELERRLFGGVGVQRKTDHAAIARTPTGPMKPMTVLYGSNTGTCDGLAQSLANSAVGRGFSATVATLDSALSGRLPTNQPVIIITASFEGAPADNAAKFVDWLEHTARTDLAGVRYAVFGCGHHDWASTYQKVPTLIDGLAAEKGGSRLTQRGESDVASGNVLDDFDAWVDEKLWPALSSGAGPEEDINSLDIEVTSSARVTNLKQGVIEAVVDSAKLLSGPGVSEKRAISFQLPEGVSYTAGDYLSVLPLNPTKTISRVLKRFGLAWDADITIKETSHTTLPTGKHPIITLLGSYVELSTPASKKNIMAFTKLATTDIARKGLGALLAAPPTSRLSVLDILEDYPDLQCPLGLYLSMLPPMRVRQYSISTSPLTNPRVVGITFNVLDISGPESPHPFLGVTTNYLKALGGGERAQIAIKKSHVSFHLPNDPLRPIIMVCAGTGIAPFKAFIEERAALITGGQRVGPAMLFVGCKNPDADRIYGAKFERWQAMGAVELYYAFSERPEASQGAKYAQDRIAVEKEKVLELFRSDAKVFVCGASRLGNAVKKVSKDMYLEGAKKKGKESSEAEVEEWFQGLKVQERWSSDVFD